MSRKFTVPPGAPPISRASYWPLRESKTIAPRILDINQVIEDMLKMLQRLIGEDIELAWLPGTRVPTGAHGPPPRWNQLMAKLVSQCPGCHQRHRQGDHRNQKCGRSTPITAGIIPGLSKVILSWW